MPEHLGDLKRMPGLPPRLRDAVPHQGQSIVDLSTGVPGRVLAAGVGIQTLIVPVPDLTVFTTAAADLMTGLVPGFRGVILGWDFVTTKAGTGTSASLVFNLEIGSTAVGSTPSTCTVTLTGTNTLGKKTAGTTVTGANAFSSTDTVALQVAASGTVFTAGSGFFAVKVQNLDTADAIASLASLFGA